MTSTLTIVYNLLRDHAGEFLTVAEIRAKIFLEHDTNMNFETVVHSIDSLKQLGHRIEEYTERRGKLKLPIKVFKLSQI